MYTPVCVCITCIISSSRSAEVTYVWIYAFTLHVLRVWCASLRTVHTSPYLATVSWVISCTFKSRAQLRRRLPWTKRSGVWSLAWTRYFFLLSKSSALAVGPTQPPLRACRVLLQKLTGIQLVKKLPAFYGTRRFITALTAHLSLFWARSIQSMPPFHLMRTHFNLIFPSTPGSSKWSFSLTSRRQNPVCTSPLSHKCHLPCSSDCGWFAHPNNVW